jgi:hypothetical protein
MPVLMTVGRSYEERYFAASFQRLWEIVLPDLVEIEDRAQYLDSFKVLEKPGKKPNNRHGEIQKAEAHAASDPFDRVSLPASISASQPVFR